VPLPPNLVNALIACGIQVPSRDCCIPLPGGAEICVQLPSIGIPDPQELIIQLFAQLNAALTPLVPIFRIIDIVLAIVECIKAIPKCLFPPNPQPLIQCFQALFAALAEILKLVPPFSLIFTVAAILDCLILLLGGLDATIHVIIEKNAAILAAALKPASPGASFALQCEKGNLDAYIKNLNEAMKPLNRLLGVINLFMQLAGQQPLPLLSSIGGAVEEAEQFLVPLDQIVATLRQIRAVIPV